MTDLGQWMMIGLGLLGILGGMMLLYRQEPDERIRSPRPNVRKP